MLCCGTSYTANAVIQRKLCFLWLQSISGEWNYWHGEDSFGSIKNSFSLFFSPPTWKRSYFICKKEKSKVVLCESHNNNQNNKRQRAVTREREISQYCKIISSVLSRNKYYVMQSSAGMKILLKPSLDRPSLWRSFPCLFQMGFFPVLLNFPLSCSQRTALLDDFPLSQLLMNCQVTGHWVFVGRQRSSAVSIVFPCAIHKGSNYPSGSYSQVLLQEQWSLKPGGVPVPGTRWWCWHGQSG